MEAQGGGISMPDDKLPRKSLVSLIAKLRNLLLLAGVIVLVVWQLTALFLRTLVEQQQLSPERFSLVSRLMYISLGGLLFLGLVTLILHVVSVRFEERTSLTLQESAILTLLLQKTSVPEIARTLGKDVRAVKAELTTILRKYRIVM